MLPIPVAVQGLLVHPDCPLAFRLAINRTATRAPSPTRSKAPWCIRSRRAVLGATPEERTPAAAAAELDTAWRALAPIPSRALALSSRRRRASSRRRNARGQLLSSWRTPNSVRAVASSSTEVDVATCGLRGIIDRLEHEDGELVVIDYKSAGPVGPLRACRMAGDPHLRLLCERVLGGPPSKCALLQLRDPVAIVDRANRTVHPWATTTDDRGMAGHRAAWPARLPASTRTPALLQFSAALPGLRGNAGPPAASMRWDRQTRRRRVRHSSGPRPRSGVR